MDGVSLPFEKCANWKVFGVLEKVPCPALCMVMLENCRYHGNHMVSVSILGSVGSGCICLAWELSQAQLIGDKSRWKATARVRF